MLLTYPNCIDNIYCKCEMQTKFFVNYLNLLYRCHFSYYVFCSAGFVVARLSIWKIQVPLVLFGEKITCVRICIGLSANSDPDSFCYLPRCGSGSRLSHRTRSMTFHCFIFVSNCLSFVT
jgi:hypothetical protein